MIEQLHLMAKDKCNTAKRGRKRQRKKFALKTISKFYPKIEPLYQGILHHENILEMRLYVAMYVAELSTSFSSIFSALRQFEASGLSLLSVALQNQKISVTSR